MAAIYIPKTINELIELTSKIIEKHDLDGDKSPLQNIGLEGLKMKIELLRIKYKQHLDLKQQSDLIREDIQLILGIHKTQKSIVPDTVRFITVQARDILKGVNRDSIDELAKWGYEISEKETN